MPSPRAGRLRYPVTVIDGVLPDLPGCMESPSMQPVELPVCLAKAYSVGVMVAGEGARPAAASKPRLTACSSSATIPRDDVRQEPRRRRAASSAGSRAQPPLPSPRFDRVD